jgi:predicted transcriptional regulator
MKLPCEICIWGLIPMIKRELVLRLYKTHKLSKARISEKIWVTKGSITQYIQGKRAPSSGKLKKIKDIDKRISDLANTLSKKNLTEKQIATKFCNICKSAQKKLGVC